MPKTVTYYSTIEAAEFVKEHPNWVFSAQATERLLASRIFLKNGKVHIAIRYDNGDWVDYEFNVTNLTDITYIREDYVLS